MKKKKRSDLRTATCVDSWSGQCEGHPLRGQSEGSQGHTGSGLTGGNGPKESVVPSFFLLVNSCPGVFLHNFHCFFQFRTASVW